MPVFVGDDTDVSCLSEMLLMCQCCQCLCGDITDVSVFVNVILLMCQCLLVMLLMCQCLSVMLLMCQCLLSVSVTDVSVFVGDDY